MPTFNLLPYPIKVSRFQHLPAEIQDFLLSDKKREDLIDLLERQGLSQEHYIKLNDIVWALFLGELDDKLLEQGLGEHLRVDAAKATQLGGDLRETVLARFDDLLSSPSKGNSTSVPAGNVVNLKSTYDQRLTTNDKKQ